MHMQILGQRAAGARYSDKTKDKRKVAMRELKAQRSSELESALQHLKSHPTDCAAVLAALNDASVLQHQAEHLDISCHLKRVVPSTEQVFLTASNNCMAYAVHQVADSECSRLKKEL